VIESNASPTTSKAPKGQYRCQAHFGKLVRWLRGHEVTARSVNKAGFLSLQRKRGPKPLAR